MPLPWLTALKVIPWADVMEHAPAVLKGARELLERQRQRRGGAPTPAEMDAVEAPGPTPLQAPAWQRPLEAVREDMARLQQTQDQITQTLAELAEQNTRLVAAVELLQKRTRLLMAVAAGLALACTALYFSAA